MNTIQNKYLVAFYILEEQDLVESGSDSLSLHSIQSYLKSQLPEYMLPSFFVCLNAFPMTLSGKVDSHALAEWELEQHRSNVAPNNELEWNVSELFAETLALPVEQIGVDDEFFHLGGNSILLMSLLNKINRRLKCQFSVANLFQLKTVRNIVQHYPQHKLHHPLVLLNQHDAALDNLFMIHPGHAGCEVYADLARVLEGRYNCYGIDNHNLYQADKIANLEQLSRKYLSYIESIQAEGHYHLLGWSLGGVIALQLAGILESKKHPVDLCLLDTYLPTKDEKATDRHRALDGFIKKITEDMKQQTMDADHIARIQAILPVEYDLIMGYINNISSKYTVIKLFKARQEPDAEKFPKNNLDLFIDIPIELIPIDCDHYSILKFLVKNKIESF